MPRTRYFVVTKGVRLTESAELSGRENNQVGCRLLMRNCITLKYSFFFQSMFEEENKDDESKIEELVPLGWHSLLRVARLSKKCL